MTPVTKIPKIEQGNAQSPLSAQQRALPNNDFSGSVKKKLASSSRTGQACDRCKVRSRLEGHQHHHHPRPDPL